MSRSSLFQIALAAMLFSPLSQAGALPDCDAWVTNRVPVGEDRFAAVDIEALKSAGVSIEPSRHMRAKDYPWEHEIQIALPPSYGRSDRPFPVLWVTDGQFFFKMAAGLATSCAHKHMPEMIVVGIGSPPEASEETQMRRTFDFGPSAIRGYTGLGSKMHNEREEAIRSKRRAEGKITNDRLGGGPRFLSFIAEDVRGRLRHDYRMADDDTLFGDSGGGLFCTYALLAQPAAFDRYVCGSPNLAAADFEVFRAEERYAQEHKDLSAAVFFGAGEAEVLEGGSVSSWGVVSSMTRMAEILKMRAYPSLKLQVRIFPGETHRTVIPLNLAWGLRGVWEHDFATQSSARPLNADQVGSFAVNDMRTAHATTPHPNAAH